MEYFDSLQELRTYSHQFKIIVLLDIFTNLDAAVLLNCFIHTICLIIVPDQTSITRQYCSNIGLQ